MLGTKGKPQNFKNTITDVNASFDGHFRNLDTADEIVIEPEDTSTKHSQWTYKQAKEWT